MKTKCWSFVLLCFTICSCKQQPINMGMIEQYLPSSTHLNQGIVSKFHEHYVPKNKDRSPYTNISYYSYQFDYPHWLTVNKYNAGLEIISNSRYKVTNEKWILDEYNYHYNGATTQAEIRESTAYDWTKEQARTISFMDIPKINRTTTVSQQIGITDTIVDDMPCKSIQKNKIWTMVNTENDTTEQKYSMSTVFAPNLGMYSRYIEYDELTVRFELVEQMSMDQFEKRANHGKKRMAYIDPQNTMDDHSNFKLCNREEEMGDYYNCNKRGELRGGKGSWWRVLKEKLDTQKLKKESGYLTYRFVLNCKGEVGRFITEESDLDFEKKTFNQETIQHLYEIVSSQTDWQACSGGRHDMQDSYTYITFKLKDGKIIDLLP